MDKIVACFGEILMRLSPPGDVVLQQAHQFDIHIGGAEANVAVALANLGVTTRMVSALPDHGIGEMALRSLRSHGVETWSIRRAAGRLGTYYYTNASGIRQGQVIYDREASVFALSDAADFDADTLLAGAAHLHMSGISLALGEGPAAACLAIAKAAKDRGMSLSFDGNFRPGLWAKSTREPAPVISALVRYADMFFGNHKDASLLLGAGFDGDGSQRRREAAEALFAAFPNLQAIASTARHVDSRNMHRIVGRLDTPSDTAESEELIISEVVDRIGTGDAFAAGVLHGWLDEGADNSVALRRGMALSALKHTVPGDFSFASRDDIEAAIAGGGDVKR